MSEVTMTYGDYEFSPVPFMNISKEMQQTPDSTIVGTVFKLTLSNTLVSLNNPEVSGLGGIAYVKELQDELRDAFSSHGQLLQIKCDEVPIFQTYPRVVKVDLAPSDDNWVFTSPYTIELEFDDEPANSGENSEMPPYISEANEEWNVEFVEDKSYYQWNLDPFDGDLDTAPYQMRVSHVVSAKGKSHYDDNGLTMPAWQQARAYVNPKLGFDEEFAVLSGTLNFATGTLTPFNHVRTVNTDEAGGSYAVTETWLVINPSATGIHGRAVEDFTVEIRKGIDRDLTSVTVQGVIQGLEERSYGTGLGDFAINTSKWENAEQYWNNVEGALRPRAAFASSGISTRSLALEPTNQTIGHNPTNGTISYSYEYNDRVPNCINGSLTESIIINDSNPVDVFASLPVLGRVAGPVLQGMNTVTSATREVTIDVVMGVGTGCSVANLLAQRPKTEVAALLCLFESDLESSYSQVFKHSDTESWNPKDGRYVRTVGWTYQNCSGTPPSLC